MPRSWQRTSTKDLLKGLSFLALIVVVSHFLKPVKEAAGLKKETVPQFFDFESPRKGLMVTYLEHQWIPVDTHNFQDDKLMMRLYANRVIGIMAKASNKAVYYANGFLQGFVPFDVKNVYNAMNFIAMRLRYQYDAEQFSGIADLWQTSKEAYVRMRGDCEDHAILLADWLVSLGFDARVAVGTYKNDGHAWVVWFHEDKAYIIEATDKRSRRSYPLAQTAKDYKAYFMFNQKEFWENPRPRLFDDYKSGWYKTAHFEVDKLNYK